MTEENQTRVDEVSKYYKPASKIGLISLCLFWINAILSICILYSSLVLDIFAQNILQVLFLVTVLIHFVISQISRFYLIPRAEQMRRKQMLSDAFGAPLSHDRTSLYYNNHYSPSIKRLGANTMENSLFSKEIVEHMLYSKRILIGGYILVWILAFTFRDTNLAILVCITQLVFSGEVIVQWLNLEILRFRHERTYETLHAHFLHDVDENSQKAIATILDAFVSYESAKSSAGYLLSSKVFNQINPELTEKWNQIRNELNMNLQQDASLDEDAVDTTPSPVN
jgi:hypothetical protein